MPTLEQEIAALDINRQRAVDWGEGAALVLAGPGAGKTRVLTMRIARILAHTPKRRFRVLGLTFTARAGDEMRRRVEALVPEQMERAVIGTFHSFCSRLLRQHGSHIGFKPNFAIYGQNDDRREILAYALDRAVRNGHDFRKDDIEFLRLIDYFRKNLVSPKEVLERSRHYRNGIEKGKRVARVYSVYENALRDNNCMDFDGLILNACRLIRKAPAVAELTRSIYPYWLIDEFQDTTLAQYSFLRLLAGDSFKNVFAVADDDQIIYGWLGASKKQIDRFRVDFSANNSAIENIQLIENHRCPASVVAIANRLISHNTIRESSKGRMEATKADKSDCVRRFQFRTASEEAKAVAHYFAAVDEDSWATCAVLARTRSVLEPILSELRAMGVRAAIVTRRNQFLSPQFVWLRSCLELVIRPANRIALKTLHGAAERIDGIDIDTEFLAATADSEGASFLERWARDARGSGGLAMQTLSEFAMRLVLSRDQWWSVVLELLAWLPSTARGKNGPVDDLREDRAAWDIAMAEVRSDVGGDMDLEDLVDGINMRPKEPPLDSDTVRLLTIHGSKGLEFDTVWIAGLADEVLPSWQSTKPGAPQSELEEERRNCFVAITRAKKELILSHADRYGSWSRDPSRFFREMGVERSEWTARCRSLGSER